MKKSFVLLALLVVSLLLAGCATDTPEVAEDYTEALLQGDAQAAQQVACEAFQDRTGELAAYFGQQDIRDLDLKYDIGKGGREEEVIVTGSFNYGPEDSAREVKLEERGTDTRIVVWLDKTGDEWCVNDTTTVGEGLLTLFGGGVSTVEAEDATDDVETEEATEEAAGDDVEDAE